MSRPRVLIVDSCRITVLLVKHLLGKVGVTVESAASGEEGLRRALEAQHPLVFMDVLLGDLDGYELCRQLREESRHKPQVIFLTGLGERFSQEAARTAGAHAVFFKPLAPSKIVEAARDALGVSDPEHTL